MVFLKKREKGRAILTRHNNQKNITHEPQFDPRFKKIKRIWGTFREF